MIGRKIWGALKAPQISYRLNVQERLVNQNAFLSGHNTFCRVGSIIKKVVFILAIILSLIQFQMQK